MKNVGVFPVTKLGSVSEYYRDESNIDKCISPHCREEIIVELTVIVAKLSSCVAAMRRRGVGKGGSPQSDPCTSSAFHFRLR
jgi:hypothetical protein